MDVKVSVETQDTETELKGDNGRVGLKSTLDRTLTI